ncbi:hypothetical protein BDV24DRAFT_12027 [Aspergillus arachidicola]|uniref:Uncharacterized protein n=1 Tax=Aspergillus arachidicola TaxID=656916 RepID=A0A5N6XS25_9EURO|nr:hypothetical protein BDV24DRAFT_12027 [Aspergillus arachidicola]
MRIPILITGSALVSHQKPKQVLLHFSFPFFMFRFQLYIFFRFISDPVGHSWLNNILHGDFSVFIFFNLRYGEHTTWRLDVNSQWGNLWI